MNKHRPWPSRLRQGFSATYCKRSLSVPKGCQNTTEDFNCRGELSACRGCSGWKRLLECLLLWAVVLCVPLSWLPGMCVLRAPAATGLCCDLPSWLASSWKFLRSQSGGTMNLQWHRGSCLMTSLCDLDDFWGWISDSLGILAALLLLSASFGLGQDEPSVLGYRYTGAAGFQECHRE